MGMWELGPEYTNSHLLLGGLPQRVLISWYSGTLSSSDQRQPRAERSRSWPLCVAMVRGGNMGEVGMVATEDEMVGWHHRLNGHEFEQTLGDGEGQGSLACCSAWGRRVGHD